MHEIAVDAAAGIDAVAAAKADEARTVIVAPQVDPSQAEVEKTIPLTHGEDAVKISEVENIRNERVDLLGCHAYPQEGLEFKDCLSPEVHDDRGRPRGPAGWRT